MTATTEIAASKHNMLTRNDTMLGICQSLGDDFGFNPDFLRVALGIMLIWQPVLTIAFYLGVGVVVLAVRLIFPDRTGSVDVQPSAMVSPAGSHTNQEVRFAKAA